MRHLLSSALVTTATATGMAVAEPTVYMTSDFAGASDSLDGIYRGDAGSAGSAVSPFVVPVAKSSTNISSPRDIDLVGSTLYYTDFTTDYIYKVGTGGGSPTQVLDLVTAVGGNPTVSHIAVNSAAQKIFFADAGTDKIYSVGTSGGPVTTVYTLDSTTPNFTDFSATPNPLTRGIEYNPTNDRIYFVDSTLDYLYSVKSDGTDITSVLNLRTAFGGNPSAFGLALDPASNVAYIADSGSDSLYAYNLTSMTGTTLALDTIVDGTWTPDDLEFWDGKLYLADSGQNAVYSFNADLTGASSRFSTAQSYNGIAIPEPASLSILGLGALALGRRRRA